MIDPNDKWVWADQEDTSPQQGPLFDSKVTPVFEWPDIPAEPGSVVADSGEPTASAPESVAEPASPEPEIIVAPAPVPEPQTVEPAPPPGARASARRDVPPSVLKAI